MSVWANLVSAINAPRSPILSAAPDPLVQGSKRTPHDADLSDANEEEWQDLGSDPLSGPLSTPRTPGPNQNLVAAARRVAAHKKLRVEQQHDMEAFATDSLVVRDLKLFGQLIAIENKLDKIQNSAPAFEVNEQLHTNIVSYTATVFFSTKLSAYKGSVPLTHVMNLVKRLRFDLPAGIEHIPADWQKVKSEVQEALTQIRGTVKKALKASINKDMGAKQHQKIFDLVQAIIKGTDCKITVPLMARIALMRTVYLEYPGEKFWDHVDTRLLFIRERAAEAVGITPAEAVTRAFKHILANDRQQHGSDPTADIDETVTDERQRQIDQGIEAETPQPAPAAPAAPAPATAAATYILGAEGAGAV